MDAKERLAAAQRFATEDEFAAFRSVERGTWVERLSTAQRLKDEGNELLNNGDFEEALPKYVEGLYYCEFHERALAMVKLPEKDTDALNAIRIPLLLNSVLCELRMNPEDQVRRLAVAESRIGEVLAVQPDNAKALFRKAQLLGRAGEYSEAKALLETLCRQQPSERAFRTELASVQARARRDSAATKAFWSGAVERDRRVREGNDIEGGAAAAPSGGAFQSHGHPLSHLLQWPALVAIGAACAAISRQWVILWRQLLALVYGRTPARRTLGDDLQDFRAL